MNITLRRMICLLLIPALFAAACGGKSGSFGTDGLNLSQPGPVKFKGVAGEILFDQGFEETIELEGEPRVNQKSFYLDDRLSLTGYDTDIDGRDDLWFSYDEDLYLVRELRDTDGDGEADRVIYYDRDENVTGDEDL